MKPIKTIVLSAVLAVSALSAQATTYTINTVINASANGFGSSGFHGQSNGRMSGPFVDKFDGAVSAAGAWETSITSGVNIYFSGALNQGGTVSAQGLLNESASRVDGVEGMIEFTIAGSSIPGFDGIYKMIFEDQTFVSSSGDVIANGVANNVIGLWGDLGNFVSKTQCAAAGGYTCLGTDLRLGITQGGSFNPPPIPLPAGFPLLAGALGMLALGRRRKSA